MFIRLSVCRSSTWLTSPGGNGILLSDCVQPNARTIVTLSARCVILSAAKDLFEEHWKLVPVNRHVQCREHLIDRVGN
ncbi:MAG TPA: hypothetical protein VFH24_01045, partial [Gemmatimonadales bacterium]|nr:hypothetical protein [Gemmatimonadales bacterium]